MSSNTSTEMKLKKKGAKPSARSYLTSASPKSLALIFLSANQKLLLQEVIY